MGVEKMLVGDPKKMLREKGAKREHQDAYLNSAIYALAFVSFVQLLGYNFLLIFFQPMGTVLVPSYLLSADGNGFLLIFLMSKQIWWSMSCNNNHERVKNIMQHTGFFSTLRASSAWGLFEI